MACQILFLPADFGISSPTPHSVPAAVVDKTSQKKEPRKQKPQEKIAPAEKETSTEGAQGEIKPATSYGSSGIPKLTTPTKDKKSDESKGEPSTPTEDASTSTPRSSPRFQKKLGQGANVSDINGGGDNIGGKAMEHFQTDNNDNNDELSTEPSNNDSHDNTNNYQEEDKVQGHDTGKRPAGPLNKPFIPPGKKVTKTGKPKRGRGRGRAR